MGPGDTPPPWQPCSTSSFLQENCRGTCSLGPAHGNALEQHRGFYQSVSWLLTKAVSSEKQHKSRGYTWMFLQVVWWSQQVSYCHWALTKQHHEELEPREQPVQG